MSKNVYWLIVTLNFLTFSNLFSMERSLKRTGEPLEDPSSVKKYKESPPFVPSAAKFDSNNPQLKAKKHSLQREYICSIKDDIFFLHTGINKKDFFRINSLFTEKIKSQCSKELILFYALLNVEKRDFYEYFAINKSIFDRKYHEFIDALIDQLPNDESTLLSSKRYSVGDRPLWVFPENEKFENALLAIIKEIIPRKGPNEYQKNTKSEIARSKQTTYFDEINDEEFKKYTGLNKELFYNIAAMFPISKSEVSYEACLFCNLVNVARNEILEALDISSSSFARRNGKFIRALRDLGEKPDIIKLKNIMTSVDKRPRWQCHGNFYRSLCLKKEVINNPANQDARVATNFDVYPPEIQQNNYQYNAMPTQNMDQMKIMTMEEVEQDIESWLNWI